MRGVWRFCITIWGFQPAVRLGVALCFLVMELGCAPDHQGVVGSAKTAEWQPWQVLETKSGRVLSLSEWMKEMGRYDIVYVGEEHYNKYHIEAALRILVQLLSDGVQPTIGMEMFGWDGQPALDEYLLKGQPDKSTFLEEVRWKQNWGGAFEDYEPLVAFARDRHISIRAMNPPKPFIRRVVKLGLEQAKEQPDWLSWGMQQEDIVDDSAYRGRIVDQLRRCHGGGTEEDYRRMYEASMVRDEGMAKTLVATLLELRRKKDGSRDIIVSYTGGGHIQYNLPVPMRVARRLAGQVKQATVYLTSFSPDRAHDIQDLLRERIADYLWLTPVSAQGSPKRCR